jgi:hypothetical protein
MPFWSSRHYVEEDNLDEEYIFRYGLAAYEMLHQQILGINAPIHRNQIVPAEFEHPTFRIRFLQNFHYDYWLCGCCNQRQSARENPTQCTSGSAKYLAWKTIGDIEDTRSTLN